MRRGWCRTGNVESAGIRKFHLRLLTFMPSGHGLCAIRAYSSAHAPLGELQGHDRAVEKNKETPRDFP